MATSRLNFEIDAGASWNEAVQWSGQDIRSHTLRMQIRRKRGGELILELTEGNGRIVVTNGNSGHFTISLNANETAPLIGEYVYDLEIVDDADSTDVVKLIRGFIYVWPEVTV
jgi:hypothetical protein